MKCCGLTKVAMLARLKRYGRGRSEGFVMPGRIDVKIGCFGAGSCIKSVERVVVIRKNDDLDILIYIKKKM